MDKNNFQDWDKLRKENCCLKDQVKLLSTQLGSASSAASVRTLSYDASAICSDTFSPVTYAFITFVGQSGQGNYTFVIPAVGVGTFTLPAGLTGNFKVYVYAQSADFIRTILFNTSNVQIGSQFDTDASFTALSAAFDITTFGHLTIACLSGDG